MRVIGGTFGGRRLVAVPGRNTRPTSDRVREALFSRLQGRYGFDGIEVLDLFAGTGALGIEAMSRGAGSLVSVELNRRAARVLLANLKTCGVEGSAEVVVRDVAGTLEGLARRSRSFQGVFLDPPYAADLEVPTLEMLSRFGLIAEGGWVSVESDRDKLLPERIGGLLRVKEDVYGTTKLVLYERA